MVTGYANVPNSFKKVIDSFILQPGEPIHIDGVYRELVERVNTGKILVINYKFNDNFPLISGTLSILQNSSESIVTTINFGISLLNITVNITDDVTVSAT